jgi:hypothetical protein
MIESTSSAAAATCNSAKLWPGAASCAGAPPLRRLLMRLIIALP